MNKNKCPKTMSGLHMWDYPDGKKLIFFNSKWEKVNVNPKCLACGMIDDTKNQEMASPNRL